MPRAALPDDLLLRQTIDELFAPRIERRIAPGAIVAVFGAGGEIAYAKGFGVDRVTAGGEVPDLDTAFRIASCTKSFTAAAALLLRDRGALVLDQPITDFVPEFHWADGHSLDGTVPTLRQLLSMSGGLSTDDPWADRQEGISGDEFRDIIAAGVPRDSLPGTRFRYSNYGYALVGRAIAQAAGRPYLEFVTDELIEPLGLTSTGFTTEGRPGRIAAGHRVAIDGGWRELPYSGPGAFSPIGGVVTTARDLARWAAWLAAALDESAGAGSNGGAAGPLSAASRRELQQVHRTIPSERPAVQESGYGFGLMVEKGVGFGHTVGHSGGYPGFSAHMRWNSPGGFGVVAFENRSYAGVSEPVIALVDALVEHAGRRVGHPSPWPQAIELAHAADRLIDAWGSGETDAEAEALAAGILSPNVALDMPLAERSALVRALRVAPLDGRSRIEASDSPAVVSWRRESARGPIRVRISLAPIEPARIQTLEISAPRDRE